MFESWGCLENSSLPIVQVVQSLICISLIRVICWFISPIHSWSIPKHWDFPPNMPKLQTWVFPCLSRPNSRKHTCNGTCQMFGRAKSETQTCHVESVNCARSRAAVVRLKTTSKSWKIPTTPSHPLCPSSPHKWRPFKEPVFIEGILSPLCHFVCWTPILEN